MPRLSPLFNIPGGVPRSRPLFNSPGTCIWPWPVTHMCMVACNATIPQQSLRKYSPSKSVLGGHLRSSRHNRSCSYGCMLVGIRQSSDGLYLNTAEIGVLGGHLRSSCISTDINIAPDHQDVHMYMVRDWLDRSPSQTHA